MKRKIFSLFLMGFIVLSCSNDNDNENTEMTDTTSEIVGTWLLTDLRIDSGVDDDDLEFAQQIIAFLNGIDCELITFTFNEDNTVVSDSKANFLSINVGAGGLDIPCPTESASESSTWRLEGNQLTFINENMEEETVTISIENGTTLILPGESIDPDNYAGADAVFTKQ
ncbi:MAG: hypothetical protein AAGL29_07585 [Bacteroidota bacterium]